MGIFQGGFCFLLTNTYGLHVFVGARRPLCFKQARHIAIALCGHLEKVDPSSCPSNESVCACQTDFQMFMVSLCFTFYTRSHSKPFSQKRRGAALASAIFDLTPPRQTVHLATNMYCGMPRAMRIHFFFLLLVMDLALHPRYCNVFLIPSARPKSTDWSIGMRARWWRRRRVSSSVKIIHRNSWRQWPGRRVRRTSAFSTILAVAASIPSIASFMEAGLHT